MTQAQQEQQFYGEADLVLLNALLRELPQIDDNGKHMLLGLGLGLAARPPALRCDDQ